MFSASLLLTSECELRYFSGYLFSAKNLSAGNTVSFLPFCYPSFLSSSLLLFLSSPVKLDTKFRVHVVHFKRITFLSVIWERWNLHLGKLHYICIFVNIEMVLEDLIMNLGSLQSRKLCQERTKPSFMRKSDFLEQSSVPLIEA